jgi:CRP-like cAMP-binding protein
MNVATDQQLELMRSIPLFAEVGKRDLKRLSESAVVRQYGPGDEIVEEGQRGVGMFVIVQGDVEATRQGTKVADLVPGTYFGELALFEDVPRNATVRAKTDVTCLVFRRWDFLAELRHEPTMALQMLGTTIRRLRETTEQLAAVQDGVVDAD